MLELVIIHIFSVIFTGLTIFMMLRYVRRHKLPDSQYKRVWGFLKMRYVLALYALTIVGWGVFTIGITYMF